jgi:hypothetical protein
LLTSKLRLHYYGLGASGCRTPLYQNAAEQPLDPTQGGDAGQLYREVGTPTAVISMPSQLVFLREE